MIAGFETAWARLGGPTNRLTDNLKTVVDRADATEPRLNQALVEYAQARGFAVGRRPGPPPAGQALASLGTSGEARDSPADWTGERLGVG